LILFVALTIPAGCSKKQAKPSSVKVAAESLNRLLTNMKEHPTGTRGQRYYIAAYERALNQLAQLPGPQLDSPMLVAAELAVIETDDGRRPSLMFQWIEEGFEVVGFYVIDEDGGTREFPQVFKWGTEDWDTCKGQAFRDTWIPVTVDTATEASWRKGQSRWQPTQLDPNVLHGPIRVGLMTRTSKTAPIEARIAEPNECGPHATNRGAP
jgi:hypothetical protein